MPGQETMHQFDVRSEFGDTPVKVTVWVDGTGAVLLGLPPWARSVRFTGAEFAALVDHLAGLRGQV